MSVTDLYKVFDQTVREITREVNRSILKVPEIEQKTLDATSNEPWGPHGQVMNEIARASRNFHEYQMIMAILWKRLQDTGPLWRHVYKSLVVMEFLVANGSERVVDELRENIYQIQAVLEFEYLEPSGKDQGINVRKKAQTLCALLKDREKIREAREKAAANRNKYGGISSTNYRSGGFGNEGGGGGGGGGGYDSYSSRDGDDYDSYRSREGGAGRRGSNYDDDSYGRREGGDRYRRERDRYVDDDPRGGGGRGRDGGDDFKQEGYSRAGQTTLQDDDDFEPRGKPSGVGGGVSAGDDDFDDFDPRASAKPPGPPPRAAPQAKPAAPAPAAPAPAAPAPVANLLDDFLTPAPAPAAPAASVLDPFAALSSQGPGGSDLFGGPSPAAPAPRASASAFSPFAGAPADANSEDDDFGGFAAAPPAAGASFAAHSSGLSSARPAAPVSSSDPFGSLSDPFGGLASAGATSSKMAPPPKSGGLWDDAISKGIVDLKISSGAQDLSSLGIIADTLGTPSSSLNPASNTPFHLQSGGMGRAMGMGSGKGIAGATAMSPTLHPVAPGVGGMSGLGLGAAAVSPPGRGMQQSAGMGFPPNMGMQGFPGAMGGHPTYGGAPNMFHSMQQQQQQQQQHNMGAFQF